MTKQLKGKVKMLKKIIKKFILCFAKMLNKEKEEWSVKIISVENGFIVKTNSVSENRTILFQRPVDCFKYKEPDKQYFVNLLYELIDYFDMAPEGKYSRQRIDIKMRKGCKYIKE
jgi:hypothetical protein